MPTRCRPDQNRRSPLRHVPFRSLPEAPRRFSRSLSGAKATGTDKWPLRSRSQQRCRSTTRKAQGSHRRRQPPRCGRKHAHDQGHWQRTSSTTRRPGPRRQDPATGRDQSTNHQEVRRSALEEGQADPSKNGVAVPPAAPAALKPVNKKVPIDCHRLHSDAGDGEECSFSFYFCTQMRQCSWGCYSLASPGARVAASTLGCCPTDAFATPLQPTLLPSALWLSSGIILTPCRYWHHAGRADFSLYM